MFDARELAENIRKYRMMRGLKQNALAKRLHVSPQSVSKWEQGLSVPDVENLCRLAGILQVETDTLLGCRRDVEKMMIGVDAGGTKTEFVLFSRQGNIIRRLVLEGCNPNICGFEKTFEVLRSGIDSLRAAAQEVMGVFCGIAGFIPSPDSNRIRKFLQECYPDMRIACGNDIMNVAASVTDEERCIAAICGTGSIICAINGEEIHRVGGWGYLFDNAGSGYDIGRDALTAALAERDGVGPSTCITALVEERIGSTVWDAINRVYAEDISYIASFSRQVFEAFRRGDAVAGDILRRNMEFLAERINFAAERYGCGDTVVIAGGVMKQRDVLMPMLKKKLSRNLKVVIPELAQIYGACVMCRRICGIQDEGFRENFAADYGKYCTEE